MAKDMIEKIREAEEKGAEIIKTAENCLCRLLFGEIYINEIMTIKMKFKIKN